MNFTEPLRRLARERPDDVAVVRARGAAVTWRELDRLVDALAHRLMESGIGTSDVVHLALTRPFRQLVLELALARFGAVASAASLPPSLARVCLVEQERDLGMHPDARLVDASWFEPPRSAPTPVPMFEDASALAILCPSSGTTGIPKAIPITHAQLAARVAASDAGAPLPASPRAICLPAPSSGYGIVSAMRVLGAGGTLVLAATPEEIVAAGTTHRVNHIVMMPYWIDRIVDALGPDGRLPALEQIEVGGAFLPRPLHALARERLCPRIYSVYGVTESGCIAIDDFDRLDLEAGEVGRALPGIEVVAFDADGRALPPGTEGMLRVRGAVCSGSYVGDPGASAAAFHDGWLVTPDLGRVAGDGTVTLIGRVGDVIVVGGYKVRPTVVEDALLSIAAIEDAAAFGAPGPNGATQLCAAFVSSAPIDMAALETAIRARLSTLSPSFVMRVPRVPRNAGGKIMRDELATMAKAAGIEQRT